MTNLTTKALLFGVLISSCGRDDESRHSFTPEEETEFSQDGFGLANLSADEQLFIYLLNRARHSPSTYQQEEGLAVDLSQVVPRPPLAVNDRLLSSSEFHASDMATRNYFSHNTPEGLTPNEMVRDAGYPLNSIFAAKANYVESLAAGPTTPAAILKLLITDPNTNPPGHRIQLLGVDSFFANHREIGVGHAYSGNATYKHYWAIHTAYSNASDKFLTGVVFSDLNNNQRYDLNEGLGGVLISAGSSSTLSNGSGGWSLAVSGTPTLTVTASGGGFSGTSSASVAVGTASIEIDFMSGRADALVNFSAGTTPPPPPPPPPPGLLPPANLTATAIGGRSVELRWEDKSGNETKFMIQRKRSGGVWRAIAEVAAGSTSYLDTVPKSGSYRYRVRAATATNKSLFSNVADVRIP